jgi:hypothetical protein
MKKEIIDMLVIMLLIVTALPVVETMDVIVTEPSNVKASSVTIMSRKIKENQTELYDLAWLIVTTPNGGEQWSGKQTITWMWGGAIPILPICFNIEYKIPMGTWHRISTDWEYCYFLWDTQTVPDGQYMIKVELLTDDDMDGDGDTIWATDTSDDWFTIDNNNPPFTPSNPTPEDDETDVDVNTDLSWTGGDPDSGDVVTYDIYFGVYSPPPKVISNQSEESCGLETMNFSTTYFWQIVAWDNYDTSAVGPIWSFATEEKEDDVPPTVVIVRPKKALYINNEEIISFFTPLIIGHIQIWPYAYDNESGLDRLELYIGNDLKATFASVPKSWYWDEKTFGRYAIKLVAYDNSENFATAEIDVWSFSNGS